MTNQPDKRLSAEAEREKAIMLVLEKLGLPSGHQDCECGKCGVARMVRTGFDAGLSFRPSSDEVQEAVAEVEKSDHKRSPILAALSTLLTSVRGEAGEQYPSKLRDVIKELDKTIAPGVVVCRAPAVSREELVSQALNFIGNRRTFRHLVQSKNTFAELMADFHLSVSSGDQWVAINSVEDLPKEDGWYLVVHVDGTIMHRQLARTWLDYFVAWMPGFTIAATSLEAIKKMEEEGK